MLVYFGTAIEKYLYNSKPNVMKKGILFGLVLTLFVGCSGVKKTQEQLSSGNYQNALNKAINRLAQNKSKKNHQPYIVLLEEAYAKNMERELAEINFLKKEGNPANHERVYTTYTRLHAVQEQIKPLLPLYIQEENREAQFTFQNYDDAIVEAKIKLSDYLYANGSELLKNARFKNDYRQAYEEFSYLEELNPGYKDVRVKMDEAYVKGVDYVRVVLTNETRQIIPERLENDLLNFDTYGLNDKWTQYHSRPVSSQSYDYEMLLAFQEILISPERISERQISKEKVVKDGYTFARDEEGTVLRDSLGNRIRIDNLITVRCDYFEFTQHKAAQVQGNIYFTNLSNQQPLTTYPLASEFVFEHIYADFDGDRRALDDGILPYIEASAVPFPTNEQMVFEAGEDLKARVKTVLRKHRFR